MTNQWHVSALEGYFSDSVEADSFQDAAQALLPFMIKSISKVCDLNEWVEIAVYQDGDLTCECLFFQMPEEGKTAELFNHPTR